MLKTIILAICLIIASHPIAWAKTGTINQATYFPLFSGVVTITPSESINQLKNLSSDLVSLKGKAQKIINEACTYERLSAYAENKVAEWEKIPENKIPDNNKRNELKNWKNKKQKYYDDSIKDPLIVCLNSGVTPVDLLTKECELTLKGVIVDQATKEEKPYLYTSTQIERCKVKESLSDLASYMVWKKEVENFNDRKNIKVDISGFDSFSQTFSGDSNVTSINLMRVEINGPNGSSIPFYVITNNEELNSKDSIKANSTSTDSGFLNLKVSQSFMVSADRGGFCDSSKTLLGGCYYGYDGGLKFNKNAQSTNVDEYSFQGYISGFYEIEGSVTTVDLSTSERSRAGMWKLGVQAAYTMNDAEAIESILNKESVVPLSISRDMFIGRVYGSINIDNVLSLKFTYAALSSEPELSDVLTYALDYQALEF